MPKVKRGKASKRIETLVLISTAIFLQGCATKLKDRSEFDKLTQRRAMGHVYYMGSESGYHFFASKYFLEWTKYYKLPEAEYTFRNPFPKTRHETNGCPSCTISVTTRKALRANQRKSFELLIRRPNPDQVLFYCHHFPPRIAKTATTTAVTTQYPVASHS